MSILPNPDYVENRHDVGSFPPIQKATELEGVTPQYIRFRAAENTIKKLRNSPETATAELFKKLSGKELLAFSHFDYNYNNFNSTLNEQNCSQEEKDRLLHTLLKINMNVFPNRISPEQLSASEEVSSFRNMRFLEKSP